MIPTFTFDVRTQRYRYLSGKKSGQFVSREKMLDLVEAKIDQVADDIDTIANLLLQNKISLATFEDGMLQALKVGHSQSYILGRSGIDRITQADVSRINNIIRREAIYLRNFTDEIAKGRLSKAQIRARARLYAESFYGTYENGRKESHRVAGFRWERNNLNVAEHCSQCLSLAAMGWQPLGLMPPIGSRICRANDRCYFTYSREVLRPEQDTILGKRLSWLQ